MDSKYSNLEFFDFENATDAEIKEVQSILDDSKKNGSLELPWQVPIRRKNSKYDHEGLLKIGNPEFPATSSTNCGSVASQNLNLLTQPVLLPPVTTQLVDPLVTLPAAVAPYPNAPYFVSRTVPYLRAFPHMGVPFFACPISGAGEANHYGQFLPIAQTVTVPGKNDPPLKTSPAEKHSGKGIAKKHPKSTVHNQIDHTGSKLTEQSLNERPTSVSVVPLPVPASTFAGAIPLHGYPPGLHTLPYTPMSVHQAPSPAMYYVPVFSHPYSSYMTPPGPPVVLPVNIHPEEVMLGDISIVDKTTRNVQEHVEGESTQDSDFNKPPEAVHQTCNVEEKVTEPCKYLKESAIIVPHPSEEQSSIDNAKPVEDAAKSVSEHCAIPKPSDEQSSTVTKPIEKQPCAGAKPIQEPPRSDVKPMEQQDTGSLSSQETCSSPESIPATTKSNPPPCSSSQCWADLFKNPHANKVNGISRLNLTENKLKSKNNFKKGIINGKAHSVPSSSTP